MQKLRRRDVKKGAIVYECTDGMFTLEKVGVGLELVRPLREVDGKVETLTFLQELSDTDTEIENLLFLQEDDDGYIDDDPVKYSFCGSQQWIVESLLDRGHKFRKEIRFLMETSFENEMARKGEKIEKLKDKGSPDIESISYIDYKSKDKKIRKDFKDDNIEHF